MAEYLVAQGLSLTFVTSLAGLGGTAVAGAVREPQALEFLYDGAFTLLVRHHLAAITPTSCIVRPLFNRPTTEVPADVVVLVTHNAPNREIYDELRETIAADLQLVGDAASPRNLAVAMSEGHRVAREIGTARLIATTRGTGPNDGRQT